MGSYHILSKDKPLLCTPKWLIENGKISKRKAYELMVNMKASYEEEYTVLYEKRMVVPWEYALHWLEKSYNITFCFND